MCGGDPNVNYSPIKIEELFNSVSQTFICNRVVGSGVDFHGDGRNSDVDVITTYRKLWCECYFDFFKKFCENLFIWGLERQSFSECLRTFFSHIRSISDHHIFCRLLALLFGSPLPSSTSANFFRSMICVPSFKACGSVSYFNTGFFNEINDCSLINFFRCGNIYRAFSRYVSSDNISFRNPPSVVAGIMSNDFCASSYPDSIFFKELSQSFGGASNGFVQRVEALPAGVELDSIVSIEKRVFSGHVYNLRTKSGVYIAENVVVSNCHPEKNRDPDKVEIECCRPRISEDIEKTKPAAIFGLGAIPLAWADKAGGIELWRGRRFPLKVGNHACWYYPMRHPSFILRTKKNSWKSDEEIAFQFDIKRAIAEVEAGLPLPIVHTAEYARSDITSITGRSAKDFDHLREFLEYAGEYGGIAGVDYETQNLRPYNIDSTILTAAVSIADETVAFAMDHPEAGWSKSDREKLDTLWVRFLKSKTKKISHNQSFESEWTCFFYGNELAREVPWEDTLTQAYVLDERVGDQKPGALSLEFISMQHFGINIKKLTQGLNKERMRDEPLDVILPYNGLDAKYHRFNYIEQKRRIEEEGLVEVYREKVRQVPTVVLTQLKGVPIDRDENAKLSKEYAKKIIEVESRILDLPEAKQFRRLTGQQFNPGSPQDVIVVLRDVLKTREGQEGAGWSTKESVISKVKHSITEGVLEYRKVTKQKSTYIDPMSPGSPDLYDGDLLHTNLGTCFTETGRLQSDHPNIQNIPVRSVEGKKVRRQFKSKIVVSFDYGQIDARIIGCGSRDKTYCKALWENYDIHAEWARRLILHYPSFVGGKKFADDPVVFENFRNRIKSIWVFALIYGAALSTTAGRFGVDESTLRPLYDLFWKIFWEVRVWQDKLVEQFNEFGYVQILGGLRRHAPLGRGQIINSGVQGATNRIAMEAMNRLSETGDPLLQPNLQIHDDLLYYFNSENEYEDAVPRIIDIMVDGSAFDWFCVPLVVGMKDGPTWADMKEVGVFSSHKQIGWPIRPKEF